MKKLVYIIGVLTILVVIGLSIFQFVLPTQTKNQILNEAGIKNNPIFNELSKESYVTMNVTEARKNLLGDKWVFTTLLRNTNENIIINKVRLRYNFSDGSEERSYSVDLREARTLPSIATDRIKGHGSAQFINVDIVNAD